MKKIIFGSIFIEKKMAKLKIELNNAQNLRDLLQNAYDIAEEQIVQEQNEINKLASATALQNESIDGKAKYAKAINDYLGMKDKAISKKIDVAKILAEIYHHNGDVKAALESTSAGKSATLDFEAIKKMVDETYQEQDTTKKIQVNR